MTMGKRTRPNGAPLAGLAVSPARGALGKVERVCELRHLFLVSTSPDGRTIRNGVQLLPLQPERLLVSTSPDGRTIRNNSPGSAAWSAIPTWFQLPRMEEPSGTSCRWYRLLHLPSFNFPGRKNHPEPASAATALMGSTGFNFPGRKNHPEHGAGCRRAARLRVSTSPDGRTIRNLWDAGLPGRLSNCFNFPGRKNHPELGLMITSPVAHTWFQLPRTEEPSGTWIQRLGSRCAATFQLPRTEEPSGTAQWAGVPADSPRVSTSPDGRTIRNHIQDGGDGGGVAHVSTSPDGRTIRNRSPQKATGGFWFENLQRADPLWPMGPLHVPP
jgi:hypothetical protein